jgi:hypothetical protein
MTKPDFYSEELVPQEMINSPLFEALWSVMRTWDINVPEAYSGYCGTTGSHVRAIIRAIESRLPPSARRISP